MGKPVTFRAYYGRFFRRLVKDAIPWARDNIGFAGFMLFAPLVVVYFYDRNHAIDWELVETTLWTYSVTLGVYLAYHFARTPWKLDAERSQDLQRARDDEAASQARIVESMRKPDPRGEALELSKSILDFVYERTQNAPAAPTPAFGFIGEPKAWLTEMQVVSQQKDACGRYESDTLGMYGYRFMRQVTGLVGALKHMGLSDEALDAVVDNPQTSAHVKIIGRCLGELADRMEG